MCSHSRNPGHQEDRENCEESKEEKPTGCGVAYMILWVRVLVKWSHRPSRFLTLNFSGCVCIQ